MLLNAHWHLGKFPEAQSCGCRYCETLISEWHSRLGLNRHPTWLIHSPAVCSLPLWSFSCGWKALQAATEAEVNWTCFVSRLNCWVPEPRKLPTLYPGLREKSTPIVSHKHFVIKKYEAEKTGCGGESRGLHRGVLMLRGCVCMCGPLSSFQNGSDSAS